MSIYRESIGLGDKYTFGTEIEFTSINLERLAQIFAKTSLPIKYKLNHKWDTPSYDVWYLDEDSTVTKKVMDLSLGGELSSRILTDKKEAWQELKEICTTLRKFNGSVDSSCSNHIRVSLNSIKDEPLFFEIFTKIIAWLESEIELFYMGDSYLRRETKNDYARSLKYYLISHINKVDFSDPDYFFSFRCISSGILLFTCKDAINLQEYYKNKLVEFRYPNGTLNEKTIQNNINFTLKLIDAIARGLFDSKELTSKVSELEKSDWFMDDLTGKRNDKGFESLVNTISTSSKDINDFMTQYEHVLSKKKTVNK